jgi:membrane protein implicated in regulation of membrane protease activity
MALELQAWITLTVIFVVGEVLSPGLFLLPFGIGGALTVLANILGVSLDWQWVIFFGVSSVLLVVFQRVRLSRRLRDATRDTDRVDY